MNEYAKGGPLEGSGKEGQLLRLLRERACHVIRPQETPDRWRELLRHINEDRP